MKKYWNGKTESMPEKDLRTLQLKCLKQTVARVYEKVPFYRARFDEYGVAPEDIQSLEDISRLPFTIKSDLRENYPFGLFSISKQDCIRIHASSGTTGKPITGGYTRNDMLQWGTYGENPVGGRCSSFGHMPECLQYGVVHRRYGFPDWRGNSWSNAGSLRIRPDGKADHPDPGF